MEIESDRFHSNVSSLHSKPPTPNVVSHELSHDFEILGIHLDKNLICTCDECNVNIYAIERFKCRVCPNYDLCGACAKKRSRLSN